MRANAVERYYDALRNLPPSGGGGCHRALLGIANLGRLAGVDRDQVGYDLSAHVHGTRKVTGAEIVAAVNKAFDSSTTNTPYVSPRTATPDPVIDGEKLLNSITKRGAAFDEAEMWEASPVRIDWPPEYDGLEVLRRLFGGNERLFLGARHEASAGCVLPASEWVARLDRGITIPEHVIPNPLTGEQGPAKDGKSSYRADSCVEQFKFAVVEFDNMSREEQIQFWAGAPLPVVALVDSGGKSIHGLIRVNAANADEWTRRVEGKLYGSLTAVGADATCKNEARLSRMPGHFRRETNRWQRLLYLNPPGGPVIP